MKIKTIILEVKDKEIELSLEEAMELKKILNNMFDETENYTGKTTFIYQPIYPVDAFRFWQFKVSDSPEQYKIICKG